MKNVFNVAKIHIIEMQKCKSQRSNAQFRIIKSSLTVLIRKWCDTQPNTFLSVGARNEAKRLGISLNHKRWSEQPKFDAGRRIFHLEHKYPVSDMIDDMIESDKSIATVFHEYQQGWILKQENAKLKPSGRIDSDAEYYRAGIEIIKF